MGRSVLRSAGFFCILISTSAQSFDFDRTGTDLIYGKDDRVEIDHLNDSELIELSDSIAVKISKRRLTPDRTNPDRILFPMITLEKAIPALCKDERFINQLSLGTCSGFLASPTKLVTAGHCMLNERDCEGHRWVFGYKDGVNDFKSEQVYSCKKIIKQKYVYDNKEVSDYAIIELDRPVTSYKPLKLRKFGKVNLGTPLIVIGHPLGLPMKATSGGVVSRMNNIERETKLKSWWLRKDYFMANLDSYGGNSGSPVFNAKTHKVEGILIQGADDFVYDYARECMHSRRLSDGHLETYEKVMRIKQIPGL